MRRGLGCIVLCKAFVFFLRADQWFGGSGWMSGATAGSRSALLHFLQGILGFGFVSGTSFVFLVLAVLVASGLGMISQRNTWISTLGGFFALTLLDCRNDLLMDDGDRILRSFLFLFCFFGNGAGLGKESPVSWPAKLIRFQIYLFYFGDFLEKILFHVAWTRGYALRMVFPLGLLGSALPEIVTYGVLIIELGLGCIWFLPRCFRFPLLIGGVLMHLVTSLASPTPLLGLIMIISYLSLMEGTHLHRLIAEIKLKGQAMRIHSASLGLVILVAVSSVGCSVPVDQHRLRDEIQVSAGIGRLDILKRLLPKRQLLNSEAEERSFRRQTILAAGASGSWDCVEFLMVSGYPADGVASDGNTLLHYAATRGKADWIKKLLKMEGVLTLQNAAGDTPLHLAVFGGHLDSVQALLETHANTELKNGYGETPLHVAAWQGWREIAAALLKRGGEVNSRTKKGETPLFYSVLRKHRDVFDLLRAHAANLSIPNLSGVTAVQLANQSGLRGWFRR